MLKRYAMEAVPVRNHHLACCIIEYEVVDVLSPASPMPQVQNSFETKPLRETAVATLLRAQEQEAARLWRH